MDRPLRYTTAMNATHAEVGTSPPADSGYTPDWGQPYGFWKTLGIGAAIYVVTLYGSVMVSQMVQVALVPILQAKFQLALSSSPDPSILEDGLPLAISSCFIGVLGSILVGIAIFLSDAPARAYFGAGTLRFRQTFAYLLAFAVVALAVHAAAHTFGDSARWDHWGNVYRNTRPLFVLWLGTGLLGPLFEELFYRGFLFAGLRRSRLGISGTIITTAALFAFTHYRYGVFGVIWIFVLGLAFGVARHRSDTIRLPLLMHMTYNLIFLAYSGAIA
jgi:hypothetical protein